VKIRRKIAGIPGFGLTYSNVLMLVVVPAVLMHIATFSYGYKFRCLEVRIAQPSMFDAQQNHLILSVQPSNTNTGAAEPEVRLNNVSVPRSQLRRALETEFRRAPRQTVFIEGDGSLEMSDIVRVIDIVRSVRPGVPVVLLTPARKTTLTSSDSPI
jgi:biopolymer transport protein ExbD